MTVPKLPEYDELRRLYLSGKSYTDLAMAYGCGRSAVSDKLKRGTEARGLPWPIPDPSHNRKRTAASRKHTSIPTDGIRLSLQEYLDERKVESCAALAERAKVDKSWISAVKNGYRPRVRRDAAARVLLAMGEQPHEMLTGYRPIVITSSYGKQKRAG